MSSNLELLSWWQEAIGWERQSRKAASDTEVHNSLTSDVKMCSTGCRLNDLVGSTLTSDNVLEKLLRRVIGRNEINDKAYDHS